MSRKWYQDINCSEWFTIIKSDFYVVKISPCGNYVLICEFSNKDKGSGKCRVEFLRKKIKV